MEYLPGIIDESLQKLNYFEILNDFNVPLYPNRFDDDISNNDITDSIEFKGGEILILRWFKPKTTRTLYSFVVGYYKSDKYHEVKRECPMSMDFVSINTAILNNITNSFVRELKIDSILYGL